MLTFRQKLQGWRSEDDAAVPPASVATKSATWRQATGGRSHGHCHVNKYPRLTSRIPTTAPTFVLDQLSSAVKIASGFHIIGAIVARRHCQRRTPPVRPAMAHYIGDCPAQPAAERWFVFIGANEQPVFRHRRRYIEQRRWRPTQSSFVVCIRQCWNSLPSPLCENSLSLSTFKRNLKTSFLPVSVTIRLRCGVIIYLEYSLTIDM